MDDTAVPNQTSPMPTASPRMAPSDKLPVEGSSDETDDGAARDPPAEKKRATLRLSRPASPPIPDYLVLKLKKQKAMLTKGRILSPWERIPMPRAPAWMIERTRIRAATRHRRELEVWIDKWTHALDYVPTLETIPEDVPLSSPPVGAADDDAAVTGAGASDITLVEQHHDPMDVDDNCDVDQAMADNTDVLDNDKKADTMAALTSDSFLAKMLALSLKSASGMRLRSGRIVGA